MCAWCSPCEVLLIAIFLVCKQASWLSLPYFDRNPQIVQHFLYSRMNAIRQGERATGVLAN
jgi:hypothetical protein